MNNDWINDKGNGVLWACQRDMLRGSKSIDTVNRVTEFIGEGVSTNWDEDKCDENFSLDNIQGILCWARYFKVAPWVMRQFPLFHHANLHPKDFCFTLFCKYPVLGFPLLPVTILAMWVSCFTRYKKRKHGTFLATDGKILAWMRCKALRSPILGNSCMFFASRVFGSWGDIFYHYHKDRFSGDYDSFNYDFR